MKKILVVDDDKALRKAITMMLRHQGYEVLDADNVTQGLALALEHRPNLVLSDVNMDGQSGFDFLKELRARPETSPIPVILMTGQTKEADARFSMDQGADDYLPKPFNMEQMLTAVQARLQRLETIDRALQAENRAERISTQEKLRLQTLALEAAANGIVITAADGTILWVNPAFTRLTGYSSDEAVGKKPGILKSGIHGPEFYADLWASITAGKVWHGELVNRRKDGGHYHEEMTITPVCGENGQIHNHIAIKQDITGRKKAEKLLTHERDLLQLLMDNLPDYIYFKDARSRFVRINRALADHLNLQSPEAAVGKTDRDYFPAEAARKQIEEEQTLMRTGRPVLGKIEQFAASQGMRWLSSTKVPVYAPDGSAAGLVGISRDITAIKDGELERQRMEVQLRQAQKLESVGQLAAGIAHEINTPTQYVGDNTRFVKESFAAIARVLKSQEELLAAARQNALTSELLERHAEIVANADLEYLTLQIPGALAETLEGVERITKIVRAMKEFSHPGGREKAPADLNKAIDSTVTVAHNEWKYVADIKLELEPDLPLIPCFLGEFNQCILNLIVNAAHAIGDVVKDKPGTKGLITVRTRRDGDHFEVRVADTGTGIPESARPHIFEPFFTTKEVGKGTGQGLSIIYGSIVKRHGGTVTFETEIGRGTTFIVRLPLKPKLVPDESAVIPKNQTA
jgi:PAS domain S-box-containing protein